MRFEMSPVLAHDERRHFYMRNSLAAVGDCRFGRTKPSDKAVDEVTALKATLEELRKAAR